jgi:hypothetical protein
MTQMNVAEAAGINVEVLAQDAELWLPTKVRLSPGLLPGLPLGLSEGLHPRGSCGSPSTTLLRLLSALLFQRQRLMGWGHGGRAFLHFFSLLLFNPQTFTHHLLCARYCVRCL